MEEINTNELKREIIKGSRRWSNYVWFILLFLGGLGFLLTGVSSYFQTSILPFGNPLEINFLPQGLVMTFYGSSAFFLSFYLLLIIVWDVGSGYNEYNKKEKIIRIIRKGFPGKNRVVALSYPFQIIKSIKIIIQDGLNTKRIICLLTSDNRQIPISQVDTPLPLDILEKKATRLAQFLEVELEGL